MRNFSQYFRVFATCPNSLISKLSEAVLSRFTVVQVKTYTENEQESVLESYCKFKNLDITKKVEGSIDGDCRNWIYITCGISLKKIFPCPRWFFFKIN